MTAFDELMRSLMTERGVSLHRLAEIVNFDAGYLCRVKNGKEPRSPELAAQLDQALGANEWLTALTPPQASRSTPGTSRATSRRGAHPDGGRRLVAAVRSIRDDLREDAKLLHVRACQLVLATDPLRAATCRGQAIACENAAERLSAALAGSQPRSITPPSASDADRRGLVLAHTLSSRWRWGFPQEWGGKVVWAVCGG